MVEYTALEIGKTYNVDGQIRVVPAMDDAVRNLTHMKSLVGKIFVMPSRWNFIVKGRHYSKKMNKKSGKSLWYYIETFQRNGVRRKGYIYSVILLGHEVRESGK